MAGDKVPRFTAKGKVIDEYKRGDKRVEARLCSKRFQRLVVGNEFELFNHYTSVRLRIVRKAYYENYASLVENEVLSDIFPGVKNEKEFLARVQEFYPFTLWDKRFVVFQVVLVVPV